MKFVCLFVACWILALIPGLSGQQEKNDASVLIDPGHGGYDDGAVGSSGLKEKDFNLQMSLRIKSSLKSKSPEIRAFITREGDYYVQLNEKVRMANSQGGIFVSIHANGSFLKTQSGIKIFYYPVELEPAPQALDAPESPEEVQENIISDMGKSQLNNQSVRLAGEIQKQLASQITELKFLGIEKAPLTPHNMLSIPSISIEIGYLSNPWDEVKLKDSGFMIRVADAVSDGIREYFGLASGAQ